MHKRVSFKSKIHDFIIYCLTLCQCIDFIRFLHGMSRQELVFDRMVREWRKSLILKDNMVISLAGPFWSLPYGGRET